MRPDRPGGGVLRVHEAALTLRKVEARLGCSRTRLQVAMLARQGQSDAPSTPPIAVSELPAERGSAMQRRMWALIGVRMDADT